MFDQSHDDRRLSCGSMVGKQALRGRPA
jgi:hypothetical protein